MLTRYIERLIDSAGVDEVAHNFCDAMSFFGYDNTFYAARFLSLPATVMQEDIEQFSNCPAEFMEMIGSRRLLNNSIFANAAMRSTSSAALDDVLKKFPDDPLVEAVVSRRLQAGRVIGLKDKVLRSQGAVMLNPFAGASVQEAEIRWAKSHHEIGVLCWVMHMRMATILRRRTNSNLTNRQRQVLEWSSAGKTIAEIAVILGVTPATVEKHLRLARDSLGAGNTAQAILKAHLTHQLFNEDEAENGLR